MHNASKEIPARYTQAVYLHLTYGIVVLVVDVEGSRWTQQDIPFGCVL